MIRSVEASVSCKGFSDTASGCFTQFQKLLLYAFSDLIWH
jgi:hypothetical protein